MSALAKALLAAQSEMPRLHKDARADTGKFAYKYLSLETLLAEVLPVLNKHGLALMQAPSFKDGRHTLATKIVHESGEETGSEMVLALADDAGAQQQGSAITYARRYSILSMLALAPDEDDDGAAAQKAPAKQLGRQGSATSPSPKQHARLGAMLDELAEKEPKAEGQLSYEEDARNWIKAKFGKQSRSQLTVSEMQDLIDEVEHWLEMANLPFGETKSRPIGADDPIMMPK